MKTIEKFQKYKDDYDRDVDITDNYTFNLKDTINRTDLYLASEFKSGKTDSMGNYKYFENVILPQCGNATKNIDVDRKDINVTAKAGKDRLKAMIYNDELSRWMQNNSIGIFLNKIVESLPKYGSVIVKKVGDTVRMVPIRNIMLDPAVPNEENSFNIASSYIIQKHSYNIEELEKEKEWDKTKVKEIIDYMRKEKENETTIYEMYAELPNKEIKGQSGKGYSKALAIISEDKEKVLYSHKVKEFPYKKVDYLTIEGRALGLGIAEMLFDAQVKWNTMANQKARSMELGSKHLYQTRDDAIANNIMTDLLDGEILRVNSEIQPISTEERNLGAYSQEEGKLMSIIRNIANAHEITTGESLPSRTPYRLGAMMQQQASKLFEFIRQNLSMFLEEVFKEWVLPKFEKEITKEHIFEVYDNRTIDLLVEKDVNRRLNQAILDYVIANGTYPLEQEVAGLKQLLISQRDDTEFVKILDKYLEFDKSLTIDISGEQSDKSSQLESVTNFMQLLGQNPTLLQDERFRPMIEELAKQIGIAPNLMPGKGQAQMPSLNESGRQMPAGEVPTNQ